MQKSSARHSRLRSGDLEVGLIDDETTYVFQDETNGTHIWDRVKGDDEETTCLPRRNIRGREECWTGWNQVTAARFSTRR